MATKKTKPAKPADPKEALKAAITSRKAVFAKHKAKEGTDAKRRLALKKLKRAQRQLGKIKADEKRIAAAKAKSAEGEGASA